jgi:hypothetical protein
MSIVPKAFYGFLVFMMLLSFSGSCVRISKMHRDNEWPGLYDREDYGQWNSWFEKLTMNTVHFLDSRTGKIACFILIVVVSTGCGILAFKYDYLYSSLFALMACTAFLSWIFVKLRFFDVFIPVIRL